MLFAAVVAFPIGTEAQYQYEIDQSISVQEYGRPLNMPWTGGLNAVQINTIDLDGDGKQDLAVFDRSANKMFTFLRRNNRYEYHPEYAFLFPDEVRHWVLLRDFNCDGKKDLFTSDSFGATAFVNITQRGGQLSWRPFNDGKPLLAKGQSGTVNIKINGSDIPAIGDIDGDGDLDILNAKFVGPSTVEWHKNISMEISGTCDSMQFERVLNPEAWGDFEECTCGQFAFSGNPCQLRIGGIINHAGGKALLTFDADNDGDQDLVMSEESCLNAFLLPNSGTPARASIVEAELFPRDHPIALGPFPASFFEDVDFDGLPDIVASPNIYARTRSNTYSLHKSIWLYKNTGTATRPVFTFVQENFLQDQMIDVGDEAYPAFADCDGDGDQDMLIGDHSHADRTGTIRYYENTGTPANPAFKLIHDDFLLLSRVGFVAIKPQLVDVNNDGNMDLVFVATYVSNSTSPPQLLTRLFVILGKSSDGFDVSGQLIKPVHIPLAYGENTLVVDVDLDGKKDVLVGRNSGALEYWKNMGLPDSLAYTLENPAFMGLGSNPIGSRSITAMDLDGDREDDLVLGDRQGHISIYKHFRQTVPDSSRVAITDIVYNPFSDEYVSQNLGGRVTPVAVNLFAATNTPVLAVGTLLGGMLILKSSTAESNDDLVTTIYPNPIRLNSDSLHLSSTHSALVEIFTVTGQRMLHKPVVITANQAHSVALPLTRFAAGIYIAKFTSLIHPGRYQSHTFIVY